MFGNKKNVFPTRPKPPNMEEILNDLKNSINHNDIAFTLLAHESAYNDNLISGESNDVNNSYVKVKNYLDDSKILRISKESINKNKEILESSVKNIIILTEEIKEQARTALDQ